MDKELEYIKLKVNWYKSVFPWILAMVAGAMTFARSVDANNKPGSTVLAALTVSVVLLLVALLMTWFAALALIHRLEEPYKFDSRLLNLLVWVPHGTRWEVVCAAMASFCLGAGLSVFVFALGIYAAT